MKTVTATILNNVLLLCKKKGMAQKQLSMIIITYNYN